MLKIWFYKRQLKKWKDTQMSLEQDIEYSNIPEGATMTRLLIAHRNCSEVIRGLELIIEMESR